MARGGLSPTFSLRSNAMAFTVCSCRRLFSRISAWMTANSAAVTSRELTDTDSVYVTVSRSSRTSPSSASLYSTTPRISPVPAVTP